MNDVPHSLWRDVARQAATMYLLGSTPDGVDAFGLGEPEVVIEFRFHAHRMEAYTWRVEPDVGPPDALYRTAGIPNVSTLVGHGVDFLDAQYRPRITDDRCVAEIAVDLAALDPRSFRRVTSLQRARGVPLTFLEKPPIGVDSGAAIEVTAFHPDEVEAVIILGGRRTLANTVRLCDLLLA